MSTASAPPTSRVTAVVVAFETFPGAIARYAVVFSAGVASTVGGDAIAFGRPARAGGIGVVGTDAAEADPGGVA
ncbi:hypothetical protein BRC68_16610 [Halobacteriales archaeon QH_6_64_20]|nr:MAG: hypothetical protein BRC68_16610 [Halobacteriales archaeon QH_6_64_20]